MKVQIAIIAGGLAIAAGVAYAELKPSNSSTVKMNTTASPAPSQSLHKIPHHKIPHHKIPQLKELRARLVKN
jgi:hypothetical protein